MPPTTINDLPSDVLLSIFRIPLLANRQSPLPWNITPTGWDHQILGKWLAYGRSMDMLAFPESIASVCRHWREVMSSVSAFWTRLVIWVGEDPTPLPCVREYLEWSRGHPIDIYILQRPETPAKSEIMATKAQVDAQVKDVMETLAPHMARWAVLCIDLQYSSPLPRPRIELVGRAEKLETLILTFVTDDSTDDFPPTNGEFDMPVLSVLEMGGMHFRQSYVEPSPHVALPASLRGIRLSDYGAHHPPFSLVDLLKSLVTGTRLCGVELTALELDCSYTGPPIDQDRYGISWCDMHFKDMNGDVISELDRLLRFPYVETRTYTRCTLESISAFGGSYYLYLDEIASPMALFGFFSAIPDGFSCHEATFTNCSGLQPQTLQVLSAAMLDTDLWWCRRLQSLNVEGCNRVTSADLRKFVEARRAAHETTGFVDEYDPAFVVASLESLHVHDCCELSDGDREWLDGHIDEVSWDGWAGGHGSLQV